MAIIIHLEFERDERVDLALPATLRANRAPSDVTVRNLSCSGCLIASREKLPVGARVSIGMSGLGMHAAAVVRQTKAGFACEFDTPLSGHDVQRANEAETIITGVFNSRLRSTSAADRLSGAPLSLMRRCWQRMRPHHV